MLIHFHYRCLKVVPAGFLGMRHVLWRTIQVFIWIIIIVVRQTLRALGEKSVRRERRLRQLMDMS